MKFLEIYRKKMGCSSPEDVFQYLIDNLRDSISTWDYFIDWSKVLANVKDLEMDLNLLNYLIGKDDIKEQFRNLLIKYPSLYRTIPALAACRQKDFEILTSFNNGKFVYKNYSFKHDNDILELSEEEIENAYDFAYNMGIIELLKDKRIKNCVDYLIGVEVGLDSNGRKNRGGHLMENIIEFYLKDLCEIKGYEYIKEATASKVYERWNTTMTVDKSSRRVDFAVFTGRKLFLIETNFYTSGGSKLKSTAGEYIAMFDYWKKDGHEFIWITDGHGWKTTSRPLEETFNHIDYLLNLKMVEQGVFERIM